MSFHVMGTGTRDEARAGMRRGSPDAAITRAADTLMMLAPGGAVFQVSASGHLAGETGSLSLSVSWRPAALQAPAIQEPAREPVPVQQAETPKEPEAQG